VSIEAYKAKEASSIILKTLNKATGKSSTVSTDFNQTNWGVSTNDYLATIRRKLDNPQNSTKFDLVIKEAKRFSKTNRRGEMADGAVPSTYHEDPRGERAQLDSDSESEHEEEATVN
jgi:hypothetical protein